MDYTYEIRLRRGSSTQWSLANPILSDGEPGYDKTLNKYKIGDGATAWNDLPWTTGEKGDPATVDVGTTTTGPAGGDASVVNSGTTQAAVFDFTIPEGIQGDPGPTGDQGPPTGAIAHSWWNYNASTDTPPATGEARLSVSSAVVDDAFSVFVSETDGEGVPWALAFNNVNPGDHLYLRDQDGMFWVAEVTSRTNNTGWDQFILILLSANSTTLKTGDRLHISLVSVGPNTTSLGDLTDVDISTTPPTTDQVLAYDGSNWTPSDASASGPDPTGAADGHVWTADGADGAAWEAPVVTTSLDDLTDVDISTTPPTTDQVLAYDGSNWTPSDASGPDPTGAADGYVWTADGANGAAWEAPAVPAQLDYGVHVVTWDGFNYYYRGATVTARPANVADYADGGIMDVDTTQDATHTSPPALTGGQAGDRWTPHHSVA